MGRKATGQGFNEALELFQWSHVMAVSFGESRETEELVFLGKQDQALSS